MKVLGSEGCRRFLKWRLVWPTCISTRSFTATWRRWELAINHIFFQRRPTHYEQSNVLVNDERRACISDFGLSRILEVTGFTTKSVGGTCRWMAQELIAPSDDDDDEIIPQVTTESDVWAFAMTAIEVNLPTTTSFTDKSDEHTRYWQVGSRSPRSSLMLLFCLRSWKENGRHVTHTRIFPIIFGHCWRGVGMSIQSTVPRWVGLLQNLRNCVIQGHRRLWKDALQLNAKVITVSRSQTVHHVISPRINFGGFNGLSVYPRISRWKKLLAIPHWRARWLYYDMAVDMCEVHKILHLVHSFVSSFTVDVSFIKLLYYS